MEIMQRHEKEKNMPNIEIKVTKKNGDRERKRTEQKNVGLMG
jgi:hypothetical protein